MLALAAVGTRPQVGGETGGEQQLQAELQPSGARGARGLLVEQRELAAEQVEHAGVGLGGLEQPPHRVAGARGGIQRAGVLAQAGMAVDGVGAGDGEQLAAPLVQLQAQAKERLQPAPEAAAGAPHALGDCAYPPAVGGVDVQDPIRLPVADRAQHHGLGLQRPGIRRRV